MENPADQQWLREFLEPWFERGDQSPRVRVRMRVDPLEFARLCRQGTSGREASTFMMDTRVIRHPVLRDSAGRNLRLLDERHSLIFQRVGGAIDIICRAPDPGARLRLMRVIRELAMGAAQRAGGRFLHAAALTVGGRGLVIAGPREAGKTSLLTYLLSSLDAGFLSNDRLLVPPGEGSVRLQGMPTIVSIRDGTLSMLPELQRALDADAYWSRLTLEECRDGFTHPGRRSRQGRTGISPAQYCRLMGCTPQREGIAAAMLFPQQTGRPGGISLRALEPAEMRHRLPDALFGHIGPHSLSEVFTPEIDFPARAPSDRELFDRLSRNVPGFVCTLGTDAYSSPEGARHLQEKLLQASPTVAETESLAARP